MKQFIICSILFASTGALAISLEDQAVTDFMAGYGRTFEMSCISDASSSMQVLQRFDPSASNPRIGNHRHIIKSFSGPNCQPGRLLYTRDILNSFKVLTGVKVKDGTKDAYGVKLEFVPTSHTMKLQSAVVAEANSTKLCGFDDWSASLRVIPPISNFPGSNICAWPDRTRTVNSLEASGALRVGLLKEDRSEYPTELVTTPGFVGIPMKAGSAGAIGGVN